MDEYEVLLTAEEVRHIGERRYQKEVRQTDFWVRVLVIVTIVYAFAVLLARNQWMVLGLLLPFAAIAFLGNKHSKAVKLAGLEFLADVKEDDAD